MRESGTLFTQKGRILGHNHQICSREPVSPQFLQQVFEVALENLDNLRGVKYHWFRNFRCDSQCDVQWETFSSLFVVLNYCEWLKVQERSHSQFFMDWVFS